jgi:predicted GNAT family acetyltransferase
MDLAVRDNQDRKRFEAQIEDHWAFIDYILTRDIIYLTHTEVPAQLEGRGIGSGLIEKVLKQLQQRGLKIAPLCPFVAAYIKKHPHWKELVDGRYNVG